MLARTLKQLDELTALQSAADETEPLRTEMDVGPVERARYPVTCVSFHSFNDSRRITYPAVAPDGIAFDVQKTIRWGKIDVGYIKEYCTAFKETADCVSRMASMKQSHSKE